MFLAERGVKVTVVDPAGILVSEPAFILNQASLLENMARLGVETLPGFALIGRADSGAEVSGDGRQMVIDCDTIVLALGSEPGPAMADELTGVDGLEVRVVGDAVGPRRVMEAVWEGFHAARLL
jgi:2-enoate reductase